MPKRPEIVEQKPNICWLQPAVLPFDWAWSKNQMWLAKAGSYARRLSPQAKARKSLLASLLQPAARTYHTAFHHPDLQFALWLKIHVERPDFKGDPINCLDLVADAVEAATGTNDRYFQLAGLTWTLNRNDPTLTVWIGYEEVEVITETRSHSST